MKPKKTLSVNTRSAHTRVDGVMRQKVYKMYTLFVSLFRALYFCRIIKETNAMCVIITNRLTRERQTFSFG